MLVASKAIGDPHSRKNSSCYRPTEKKPAEAEDIIHQFECRGSPRKHHLQSNTPDCALSPDSALSPIRRSSTRSARQHTPVEDRSQRNAPFVMNAGAGGGGAHTPGSDVCRSRTSSRGDDLDDLPDRSGSVGRSPYLGRNTTCNTPRFREEGRSCRFELEQNNETPLFSPVESSSPQCTHRSFSANVSPLPIYARRGSELITGAHQSPRFARDRAESDAFHCLLPKGSPLVRAGFTAGGSGGRICDAVFEEERKASSPDVARAIRVLDAYKDLKEWSPRSPLVATKSERLEGSGSPRIGAIGRTSNVFFSSLDQPANGHPFVSPRISRIKPEDLDPTLYERSDGESNSRRSSNAYETLHETASQQPSVHNAELSGVHVVTDEPEEDADQVVGKIYVAARFDSKAGSLVVELLAADLSLCGLVDANRCSLYVQLTMQPHGLSKESTVKRRTKMPRWNEEFLFAAPSLNSRTAQKLALEIVVKDYDKESRCGPVPFARPASGLPVVVFPIFPFHLSFFLLPQLNTRGPLC